MNDNVSKEFKTDSELKQHLNDRNIMFTDLEFQKMKQIGYFRIVNAHSTKKERMSKKEKYLKDYLIMHEEDKKIRSILQPILIELEGRIKQQLNEVIRETLLKNGEKTPYLKEVVKGCVQSKYNYEAKNLFYRTNQYRHEIIMYHMNNHLEVPIWIYLELFSLSTFSKLVLYTTMDIREKLTVTIGLSGEHGCLFSFDQEIKLLSLLLRIMNDIRNNIAHNQSIIGCEFKKDLKINKLRKVCLYLSDKKDVDESDVIHLSFEKITDYLLFLYLVYKRIVGSGEYGDALASYIKGIGTNDNINNKLRRKIFGDYYLHSINLIV